ncbi:MAG: HAD family phosphatase [Deltaproteobacteria bacterium]|nr:HAD family phosphatase [Deltaproteobacteria bacterium]
MLKYQIDTVLFDFGGVLAEEGFREGLKAIARLSDLDEDAFFHQAEELIYSSGYVLGKATENAYWQALREATGVSHTDDFMRKELVKRFLIRPWMLEIVDELRAQNYRVGILSDQTNWLDMLDKKYALFKHFDRVYNSFYLKKGKRDPGLFDGVARDLRVPPRSILFIDDNAGHCDRARKKGFCVIHYTNKDLFLMDITGFLPSMILQESWRGI